MHKVERIDVKVLKSFYIVVNRKRHNEIIVRNSLNGVIKKEIENDITADLHIVQYYKGQEYTLNNINEETIQELLESKIVKRITIE